MRRLESVECARDVSSKRVLLVPFRIKCWGRLKPIFDDLPDEIAAEWDAERMRPTKTWSKVVSRRQTRSSKLQLGRCLAENFGPSRSLIKFARKNG